MKVAFLMQCHKNPEQINLLLKALKHPQVDVYVHVDSKSESIRGDIGEGDGIIFFQRRTVLMFSGDSLARYRQH